MIYIENSGAFLNLLNRIPEGIRNKLLQYEKEGISNLELVVLINGDNKVVADKIQKLNGTFKYLGYGFGIINIPIKNLDDISKINEIIYVELPKTLYTSFSISNKASCVDEVWNSYNLSGKGVLVGFIDSGIDYTHPAFRDLEGKTRIKYIYDVNGSKVWNEADINRALESSNPYSIVTQRDDIGHGTHVAGIACGGGKIDKRYYGPAYESSIAMVKMTREGKVNYSKSTQLMEGIKFLIDRSKELNMPLVLNLSFSTNDGAHDGNSLLELYIRTINSLERISFVIAAGNEGDAGHHVGGDLGNNKIQFNIDAEEPLIKLQLYKDFTNDISIEIKNPAGLSSGIIDISKGDYFTGRLGEDNYYIYNSGPTSFNINGEILIILENNRRFVTSGTWEMNLNNLSDIKGNYDIWLPISEGLGRNTKFLNPDPYNTLGIPGTVSNAITVGSYNSVTNNISTFSGRGKRNGLNPVKPDIVAPGENIESSIPGGRFDSLSGTSMATPEVTGSVALLTEWGLVKGNDSSLYGERLKYYVLKGAKRDRKDINYPNSLWGYGNLCLYNAFQIWIGEGNLRMKREVLNRQSCGKEYIDENFNSYIVEYDGDIVKALANKDYGCAFILDENYAVVSVKSGEEGRLQREVPEIIYMERNTIYTLNDISPLESANISKFHENPFLNLTGRGVLIGMVDTGIDYLNSDFIYEDGTSKIFSIWDQTINTEGGERNFGTEYKREKINEAINAKKAGKDPYAIVPSKDDIGHGTNMASLIAGRTSFIGAAPDSEIVCVKLKRAKKITLENQGISSQLNFQVYSSTDLILGIRYLISVAKSLNQPMVIYIPLGTNMGAHDGSSILERYIDEISKTRGVVVVTSTGNEGDNSTHASGQIKYTGETRTVELKVDDEEKNLTFEVWVNKPDKVSLGLVSPSGEVIEKIPAKLKETEEIQFVFEGSRVSATYYFPEEATGDELILVNIQNIRGGIWLIRLTGDSIVDGTYNIWLPQKSLIKQETRFIKPDSDITLTIPSTSKNIIATSVYNQNNNTMVAFSGRGFTRDGRIKPDLATGGVSVATLGKGNNLTTVTGGSVASAVLAGAVALLLQWGIVDGRDKTMYSTKIRTYLIRGTSKRPGDIYPNKEWGYGKLDLEGVFQNMRSLDMEYSKENSESMFINIPQELYNRILNNIETI